MQSPPSPCYLVLPRSKYSPQHHRANKTKLIVQKLYAVHDQCNILCILEGCGQKENLAKRKAKYGCNDFNIMVIVSFKGHSDSCRAPVWIPSNETPGKPWKRFSPRFGIREFAKTCRVTLRFLLIRQFQRPPNVKAYMRSASLSGGTR